MEAIQFSLRRSSLFCAGKLFHAGVQKFHNRFHCIISSLGSACEKI
jgi:hypothetical protein